MRLMTMWFVVCFAVVSLGQAASDDEPHRTDLYEKRKADVEGEKRKFEQIIARCAANNTALSFCGEDAGRPVEALALAALGLPTLSMRPASIGPVKHLIRRANLRELREIIVNARDAGAQSLRPAVTAYLANL